jgi:DNA polymerase/3'-5' exonuclease PolX
MDYKSAILSAFETMETQAKMGGKATKWSAISYARVKKQIEKLAAVHDMDDLAGVTGIGEGLTEKLYEIFETGSLAAAEKIKAIDRAEGFTIFQDCYGIGAKKAKDLAATGLTSLAQLRAAAAANPKLLTAAQTIGLRHYEEFLLKIPRAEMVQHETFLRDTIPYPTTIMGSYRRGAAESGDIDTLLCSDGPASLWHTVTLLTLKGYITATLAHGEKKFMGVCKLPGGVHRRLDILLTPVKEVPFALVYFTGPMSLNVAMRKHCLEQGLSLNEHGFTATEDGVELPDVSTEKGLFRCLGLEWIAPEERDKKKLKLVEAGK